jgi:hypothetical protein
MANGFFTTPKSALDPQESRQTTTQTETQQLPPEMEALQQDLLDRLDRLQGGDILGDLLADPLGNPLFTAILGPVLENLVPQEELARRNLRDEFRRAGALKDTTFGRAAAQLEGDVVSRRGSVIAQLAQSLFGDLAQAAALQTQAELGPIQEIARVIASAPKTTVTEQVINSLNPLGGGGGGIIDFGMFGTPADQFSQIPISTIPASLRTGGGGSAGGGMVTGFQPNERGSDLFDPQGALARQIIAQLGGGAGIAGRVGPPPHRLSPLEREIA